MALIIPNATDTTGGNKYDALDQAEPDALDFEVLGMHNCGVLSGCVVTSAGTNNTVNVSAGTVVLNGVPYSVSASSGFGLPTAPADKRFDIIVARVSGGVATLTAVQGTNSATNPSYPKSASVITTAPSPTTNVNFATDVVLAAVYRNGSATVTDSRIVDKRTPLSSSILNQGAAVPSTAIGTGSFYYKTGTPSGTASGVYVQTSTGTWIELAQNVGPHIPIGGVISWPCTDAVPSGYVEANGQALSTSAYPALFAKYGYLHGGSGGTFNVPNYNNLFLRGTTNTSLVGTAVGADSVTLITANIPNHSHTLSHTHTFAHSHGISHGHTASSSTDGSHQHSYSGSVDYGGGHTHYSLDGQNFVTNVGATLNLQRYTSGSPFTVNYVGGAVTTESDHFHYYSGTTNPNGSHAHTISVTDSTASTSSQSVSTTSDASNTTTSSVGSGTSFSVIPGSAYTRWIICASLGTDPSFTGGITGPWSASQTVTAKTASYVALTSDIGNLVTITSGSATDLTINTSLGMVAGQRMDIVQGGAGIVTVVASGTTITSVAGLRTKGAGSFATLICTGTNTYILTGDTQV